MDTIRSRFLALRPEIEQIMTAAGVAGLTYGIFHQGQLVHTDNFGYRDVEKRLPIDEDTMFPICSMTKGMVSSVLGMLVEEKKLSFDDYVTDLLPSFDPPNQAFKSTSRLSDWLSMQSGTQGYQCWVQSENNIIIAKDDAMKVINGLRLKADMRTEFTYSNWGYELASRVIQELTGESWDEHVHKRIFEPLQLARTDARGKYKEFGNFATPYMALDDATPITIPQTPISSATLNGAAGGIRSCMKDLLVLYQAVLTACIDQFRSGKISTENSVFKNLIKTMSPHNQLPGHSLRESSYGYGWIRTQLPNQMCRISPNYELLGEEPVLGEGAPPKLLISHYGSMPGSFCGVNLFPETESFVVMLSNSTPMCDSADWFTQLLTQTLFDFPKKNDYLKWVKRSVEAEREWYPKISKELDDARNPDTEPKELRDYVGSYVNEEEYFMIAIKIDDGRLIMSFQGRTDEEFELRHYEHDTFCWLQPRNDLVKRARNVLQPAKYYLISFHVKDNGEVDHLSWVNDGAVPEGQKFIKQ
jgi:CubicO group peptidase (beta-lactamase class C family)